MLDLDRVRKLFDLRGSFLGAATAAAYDGRSLPDLARPARAGARARRHRARADRASTVPPCFHGLPYPDRPHFSAFSYAACDGAYRNDKVFASSPVRGRARQGSRCRPQQHAVDGRGAAPPVPGSWCSRRSCPQRPSGGSRNWIEQTVHLLIDSFEGDGRAELNVDFCAAIPVLTITGSFGVPVEQALDIREALAQPGRRWSRSSSRSSPPAGSSRRTT